jgi:hypothetical protein
VLFYALPLRAPPQLVIVSRLPPFFVLLII